MTSTGDITLIRLSKETERSLKELERLTSRARVAKVLGPVLDRQGLLTAGYIAKNFLSGQRLRRRSGTLARSIVGLRFNVRGMPALRVGVFRGPAQKYFAIQEEGGTIRPKRAKALAVPTEGGEALTPAGVPRYAGPRDFPRPLTFIPFRRSSIAVGGLYPTDKLETAATLRDITPAYILLRKAVIKPKHYIRDGVRDRLPMIAGAIAEAMRKELQRAFRGRTSR